MGHINSRARIPLCGAIAEYNDPIGSSPHLVATELPIHGSALRCVQHAGERGNVTKVAGVQTRVHQCVHECIRRAVQQAFPLVEKLGRAWVKTTHAQEIRPRAVQCLLRSSAKPVGDPFMQGQAPTVFPRHLRNERDMDAETDGRSHTLEGTQTRALGSGLISCNRWLRGAGQLGQSGLRQTGGSSQADNRIHASSISTGIWLVTGDLLLLLEFQSTIEPAMAVRVLTYASLLYEKLIDDGVLREHGKLPPVLPIVIYNGGQRWTAAEDVAAMIAFGGEALAPYQPSLRYYLLDEGRAGGDDLPRRNLS